MLFRSGPITLSKGIGLPIFSQVILIIVLVLFNTFYSLSTIYPNVPSFYTSGCFIDLPVFALFIPQATRSTLVMGLSLTLFSIGYFKNTAVCGGRGALCPPSQLCYFWFNYDKIWCTYRIWQVFSKITKKISKKDVTAEL